MKKATFGTLFLAALTGCAMLVYGPWWLVIVGALIMLFALAYSAGPYPLSHHGLGDVAVVIFFGIVPVTFTYFLQSGTWEFIGTVVPVSVTVGLLAANVLVVNNYRDMEDDSAVGKRTTVVIFGRKVMGWAYLISGIVGMACMASVLTILPLWALVIPIVYLVLHIRTWLSLRRFSGAGLNPLLGRTTVNLLIFTIMFFAVTVAAI